MNTRPKTFSVDHYLQSIDKWNVSSLQYRK
jgi:hypothetical protein